MRRVADADLQIKLLEEIQHLYLKRGELETHIRNIDLVNKLRIEKGALLDIEVYRAQHFRPDYNKEKV
jgi:hypothetical protein